VPIYASEVIVSRPFQDSDFRYWAMLPVVLPHKTLKIKRRAMEPDVHF